MNREEIIQLKSFKKKIEQDWEKKYKVMVIVIIWCNCCVGYNAILVFFCPINQDKGLLKSINKLYVPQLQCIYFILLIRFLFSVMLIYLHLVHINLYGIICFVAFGSLY